MAADGQKKMITLKSSDGEEFEVEEAVAMESQTIRHLIEDDCADNGILLPNVNSNILSKVIEYCNKHGAAAPAEYPENWDAEFVMVDDSTLVDIMLVIYVSKKIYQNPPSRVVPMAPPSRTPYLKFHTGQSMSR